MAAARALPGPGWHERIAEGRPRGPAETFLAGVRDQVYGRSSDAGSPYDLECTTEPLADGLAEAAANLETALGALAHPMKALTTRLAQLLDTKAAELDTSLRQRIEATSRGLRRRTENEAEAWQSMLQALTTEAPGDFVDWFSVSRDGGRDTDFAMHRHWIDPTVPFATAVAQPAHGVLVTSATLRDGSGDTEADWRAAEIATGALHLNRPAIRAEVPSPFDYPKQTRVIVVTDVDRGNGAQVAAAYRELFLAANGGALGLFTAIMRLRHVHGRIAAPLEAAGLRLYAQHVDSLDTASLVDIFRTDEDSCLLGTDAVRDGVDVPGRALRLVVFDRVPWPRPSILHRARRRAHAGKGYDDMIARLRLKQAFGRLVRKADDWGVFVMLDRGMPSRLAGAFPDGVEVRRLGLKDAIELTGEFLSDGRPS
jgi:ATP-dependent DNA helicase DinG